MKKTTLAFAIAAGSITFACATAAQPQQAVAPPAAAPASADKTTDQVLMQALVYNFRIRTGEFEVVPELVAMLDEAISKNPGDAALWAALGNARYMEAAGAMRAGQNPANAMPALQKAFATHEHALELDPDQPVALAGRGQGQVIAARFQSKPEMIDRGIADMNRAVDLAPDRRDIRLVRAFTTLNIPADKRDMSELEEDIVFLQRAGGETRQGAMMHVLLGDLRAEAGKPDLARAEYAIAARSATPAGETGRARMAALDKGGVPASEINLTRNGLGSNCMMCHGS